MADHASPLTEAVARRDAAEALRLLRAGADPNVRNARGWYPLHEASHIGDASTVTALLDHGADLHGRTTGTRATPLYRCAQENHVGVARLLLDRGAAANAQLKDGATALSKAAKAGYLELAQVLLDHGADPNLLQDGMVSPLMIAAKYNHVAIAAALLAAGADRSLVDGDGATAFDKVLGSGNFALLQLLAPAQERSEPVPQGGPQDDPVGVDPVPLEQPPVHADQECQFNGTLHDVGVGPGNPHGESSDSEGARDALAAEATTRRDAAAEMLTTQSPDVRAALDRFVACLARLRDLEGTPEQCASGESTAELQAARAASVEAASALEVFPPDAVPYNDAVAAAVAAFDCEVEDFRSNASEIATFGLGDPCRASVVQAVKSLRLLVASHDETQTSLASEMDRQTGAFDGEAWATAFNTGQAEAEAVLKAQTPWCGDDGLAEAQKRLRYRNATATKVTFRRREHGAAACNLDNKLPSEDSVALQQRRDEAAEALAAAEERLAGAEASAHEALLRFPGLTLEVACGAEGAEGTAGAAACESASAGNFDVLQDLLLRDPSLAGNAEANGEPLLHHGVRSGDLDIVRLLLSFPTVDPLCRSSDGTLAHELALKLPDRKILGLLTAPLMASLRRHRRNSETPSAASARSMAASPDAALSDVENLSAEELGAVAPIPNFSRVAPRGGSSQCLSSERLAREACLETDRTQSDQTCGTRAGAPVALNQPHLQAPSSGPLHTLTMYEQRDCFVPHDDSAVEDASMMPPPAATHGPQQEPLADGTATPGLQPDHVATGGSATLRGDLPTRDGAPDGRVSPSGSSVVYDGASEYGAHTDTDDDGMLLVRLEPTPPSSAARLPSAGSL